MIPELLHPDPAVAAAIAQAERMVRLEEGQNAILKHVEKIEGHMAAQNGRVGKLEERLGVQVESLTHHLRQIEDRQEFPRLVQVESRTSKMEQEFRKQRDIENGVNMATKRFIAVAGGMVTVFNMIWPVFLKYVIGV